MKRDEERWRRGGGEVEEGRACLEEEGTGDVEEGRGEEEGGGEGERRRGGRVFLREGPCTSGSRGLRRE